MKTLSHILMRSDTDPFKRMEHVNRTHLDLQVACLLTGILVSCHLAGGGWGGHDGESDSSHLS